MKINEFELIKELSILSHRDIKSKILTNLKSIDDSTYVIWKNCISALTNLNEPEKSELLWWFREIRIDYV